MDRIDAAKWNLFCDALDAGRVSVICEGHPDRTDTIDGGVIVNQLDEVAEHLVRYAYEENPEGLPFHLREVVAVLESEA